MGRDISLTGGEITILKTLGFGGAPMSGANLLKKVDDLGDAEVIDLLQGLLAQDYVLSSKVDIRKIDDVKTSSFRVSPANSRNLRDALSPSRDRAQARDRRQRRS